MPGNGRRGETHLTADGRVQPWLVDLLANRLRAGGRLPRPLVVDDDLRLIDGRWRLAAYRQLGWTTVDVVRERTLVAALARAEKVHIKYTPSQAFHYRNKWWGPLDALARARQRAPLRRSAGGQTLLDRLERAPLVGQKLPNGQARRRAVRQPMPYGRPRRTRDWWSALVGYSGPTLDKVGIVVHAAWANPQRCQRFATAMDRTGNVEHAWRAVTRARWSRVATASADAHEPRWVQFPLPAHDNFNFWKRVTQGLDQVYRALWAMRALLEVAEPGQRILVRDDVGKVTNVVRQGSTYPPWLHLLGTHERSAANCARVLAAVRALLDDGPPAPRTRAKTKAPPVERVMREVWDWAASPSLPDHIPQAAQQEALWKIAKGDDKLELGTIFPDDDASILPVAEGDASIPPGAEGDDKPGS